ncbi:aminotransferase class I/II-fold pyridoxal phosphate-dependent enzyme [Neomoorella thermoacetica]|uniref:aminotransferase class I/II-fold pyridoxal phosphate-dependent enzyme n=1 Tax=Neomoorella thermoacetica TaxID=1525 RepID=UPI0011E66642|nr:aminotransferase class I/II-fold pyridoxal phosphate-dependent enzyme [Moorella thermoacetica]
MKTQGQAPLWEALLNYRQQGLNSWHTPGHKDGAYTLPLWRDFLGAALALDLTEVPGLDNLACPGGAIAAAQERAARFYGTARTFFLVNGASAGLMAVILATCRPGDEVLLPRYAHRAVFNGLILSGARPVYLATEWLASPGLPLGVAPESLAGTLREHPGARLLLLVHPTYEGVVPRSEELIALAHAHGVAVLADAAHGAHFGLAPGLPPSPLDLGADFVVQSSHKTLAALTQAAMLHLREEAAAARVAAALNLLQTTSPSYLLLASLDTARLLAEERGRQDWGLTVARATAARARLDRAGLPPLAMADVTGPAASGLDVTRLLLPTAPLGRRGTEVAATLRRAGQEVELAGEDYIVVIITPGDGEEKIEALVTALLALPRSDSRQPAALAPAPPVRIPETALTPREAWLAPRRELPLGEATGKIAAELISPCPPGLALTVPGEVLTPEVLERLRDLRRPSGRVLVVDG